jgi:hypothetical protein
LLLEYPTGDEAWETFTVPHYPDCSYHNAAVLSCQHHVHAPALAKRVGFLTNGFCHRKSQQKLITQPIGISSGNT